MKVAIVGDLELTPAEEPERNPGVLIKAKTVDFITRPEAVEPVNKEETHDSV